jgi:hypothetical protein
VAIVSPNCKKWKRNEPLALALSGLYNIRLYTPQAENVAKALQRRFRFTQRLNVEEKYLGFRKHLRGFSVLQDPLYGRTAHTKCGVYLLASSLAAALPVERRV